MLGEFEYLLIAAPRGLVEKVRDVATDIIPAVRWSKTRHPLPFLEQ
jgi:hypothetical protein